MSLPPKTQHIAVKLKRKRPNTEHDGPLLARFPHGPPAQLMHEDQRDDITFKMYANSEERKSFQRILVASAPRVSYSSQNFGGMHSMKSSSAATATTQQAIGIYEPSKGKVKIVPVKHVYRMEQYVDSVEAMDVEKEEADEEITFSTKQRTLADTFGSKKRQKQLQSRAANQVTLQESTSQVLTHAVSTIQPNEERAEEDTLLENIRKRTLPKYDESAEHVREIYPISGLMPQPIHESLASTAKAWRSVLKKGNDDLAKAASSLTSSLFIQKRLQFLAKGERSSERETQLKLLILFHLMVLFRQGGKNKKKVVMEWDANNISTAVEARVKEHLLHTFTTKAVINPAGSSSSGDASSGPVSSSTPIVRSVFDSQCEQKLLCHLAVISLWLTNFTIESELIDLLATDMRMMTSEMLKYYVEIGCSASKSKIALHAPLKLPVLRKRLEKKKK